jgi:Carboxypeptidase regulatory-like domain
MLLRSALLISLNRRSLRYLSILSLLAACAALPRVAVAQTSTGELSITVLDPTGAVVPNATVTITGSETGNALRTMPSNDKGLADAPLIQPGNYDISVTASGFKTTVRRRVPVNRRLSAGRSRHP